MKKMLIVMMLMVGLVSSVFAAVETNSPVPDFTLPDSHGEMHSLSDYQNKYVILEWVNYDCPFVVKQYKSGNMQALQSEMTADGVVWLSINSSAEGKQGCFEADEINEKITERDANPTAYLIDKDGTVGKLYGAKTTPHMFIISPEGVLLYQGAIDSIPSFDVADIGEATNYIRAAFEDIKAGRPVQTATTKSYGCSVKY